VSLLARHAQADFCESFSLNLDALKERTGVLESAVEKNAEKTEKIKGDLSHEIRETSRKVLEKFLSETVAEKMEKIKKNADSENQKIQINFNEQIADMKKKIESQHFERTEKLEKIVGENLESMRRDYNQKYENLEKKLEKIQEENVSKSSDKKENEARHAQNEMLIRNLAENMQDLANSIKEQVLKLGDDARNRVDEKFEQLEKKSENLSRYTIVNNILQLLRGNIMIEL